MRKFLISLGIAVAVLLVFVFFKSTIYEYFGLLEPTPSSTPNISKKLIKPIICQEESVTSGEIKNSGDGVRILKALKVSNGEIEKKLHQFNPKQSEVDAVSELKNLLIARKKIVLEAMSKNPEILLTPSFSEVDYKTLDNLSENCVEKKVSVEGTLTIWHYDFIDKRYDAYVYELLSVDGSKNFIYPAYNFYQSPESGNKIKVEGFKLDKKIIFDSRNDLKNKIINSDGGYQIISRENLKKDYGYKNLFKTANAAQTGLYGDIKIAAKVYVCPGVTNPNVSANSIRDVLFGSTANNTVKQYWEETSYGQITISGDVYEVLQSGPNCQTVSSPQINETNYNYIINIGKGISPGATCGYSLIGGREQYVNDVCASYSVISHELGHGFGLYHSGGYGNEYGNFLSVMGLGQGHIPTYYKKNLGWLEDPRLISSPPQGRYTLTPYENPDLTLKSLGLITASNYYTIEYRQPIGMDSNIPSSTGIFNGGAIHRESYIIDPTPPDDPNSSALLPGQTFVESTSGFKITAISANSSGLVIDVFPGKNDFNPPNVSIINPADSTTVLGNITVIAAADDVGSGLEKVEFSTSSSGTPFATLINPPYQAILDTTQLPDGYITIVAQATDLSGKNYNAPGNIGYASVNVIVANTVDTTPPTVDLIIPADGEVVSGFIRVGVNANDNVGFSKLSAIANGVEVGSLDIRWATKELLNMGVWWDTTTTPDGSYKLEVTVTDINGNKTTSLPINIVIDNIPDNSTPTPSSSATPSPSSSISPSPSTTVTTTPTPTPIPTSPIGGIDIADCNSISGWAFDQDNVNNSIQVRMYLDGAVGTGTLLSSQITNILRSDINSNYSIGGVHGFNFITPASIKNGVTHNLYVYGINSNSTGANTLLSGSPVSLSCSIPTPNPSPIVSGSPAPSPSNTPTTSTYPTVTPTPYTSLGPNPSIQPQSLDIFENFNLSKIPTILSGLSCYIVQLAIILFGVWLLYAGIKFFLSRGDATKYTQAKKTFYYSLIGGLIIYGVYTIIITVASLFGINSLPWIPLSCS